ncbi:hypothetical protein [Mesorhizobium sp. L-8-10]|uniref:hypothetical protein n=1 Tax=Mesorhizobium sp. L-8-10 TaxID=2744523 RepID=UPI001926D87F|nr:hypothetical protein [Mesorhizobium sp. L-8-10]
MTNAVASMSRNEVCKRAWPRILSEYRKPHRGRSLFELAVTLVPFVSLWALEAIAIHNGFWWGVFLTIPAAGFLLRLFIVDSLRCVKLVLWDEFSRRLISFREARQATPPR